jgi:hypothetical protein
MADRPKIFWDSSALIDAIFALDESPYRGLLGLGESNVADMRVSPDVLRECQAVLRWYGDDTLLKLAAVLVEANFATTSAPNLESIEHCKQLTGYRNDALILGAADQCRADVLLTHDRQHFIGSPLISPPEAHCRALSAADALDWCIRALSRPAADS